MKNKKTKKVLFIVFAIIILIGIMSIISASSCSDSDSGKNYNVKGMVTGTFANGNAFSIIDYCSITDANKVSEQYCVDTGSGIADTPTAEWYTCPSGVCQDGACVVNAHTCTQNGGVCRTMCNVGEYNIGILNCGSNNCCKPGGITDCPTDHPDGVYYCDSSDLSSRFKCQSGTTSSYSCGSGNSCSNGNCISNPNPCTSTCSDLDGNNTETKGTVTAKFVNCQSFTTTDYCSVSDASLVSEGICIGTSPSSNWLKCPTNEKCVDGKCSLNTGTCTQNGGTCRDICNVGEHPGGKLDCNSIGNNFDCCLKGGVTTCPSDHPENKPYCSSIVGDTNYLVCNGGITSIVKCKGTSTCSDGTACYGVDIPIITPIMDWIKTNIVDKLIDFIFGNESSCKSCDAFIISQTIGGLVNKTCTPKLVAIPPQTNTTCFLSYIKFTLMLICPIFVILFGMDFFERFKTLKGKKKQLYRFIISLLFGLFLSYLIFVLFWVGVIIFILYIIMTIGFKNIKKLI